MRENPLIIFLHVPKTAGTTLQRLIERQYQPRQIFHLLNPQIQESIDRYNNLPDPQRHAIRIMHGHVFYGIHESFAEPSTYMTILREPIDRVISHFYFIQRRPRHFLYQAVTEGKVGLDKFIYEKMSLEVDNGQVRQLCGLAEPFKSVPYGKVTREMLENAKQNLRRRMSVVGLAEEFDRSLILFKHLLGWRTPYYYNANVTRNRPAREQVSSDVINMIQESNQLDRELYESARELFAAEMAQQGPAFDKEVQHFQKKNEIYGRYLAYCHTQFNRAKKAPRKLWSDRGNKK